MALHDYHFLTHWTVRSSVQEVSDILGDAPGLARWWPSVYLGVQIVEPGEANGLHRRVAVYTKGWLPYTLLWHFRVIDVRSPHGFSIAAEGDFVGRGDWTFTQRGDDVLVNYDWRIRAEKPLLRALTPLLKPLFAFNHRWAMERGQRSLRLELARQHAASDDERAWVPPPPPPTWPHTSVRSA